MKEWLESVYSDGTRQFVSNPCPKKNERITVSVCMIRNEEVRHVFLRTKEFGVENVSEMDVSREKGKLVFYSKEIVVKDPLLHYQFYIATDDKIYYYTQFRITDYIPAEDEDFRIPVDFQEPGWVKDTVFYQIFPDRFRNARKELNVKPGEYSYQGAEACPVEEWDTPAFKYGKGRNLDFRNGDIYGIIEKLDYLQELGVNGIYLNPVFVSPSIHKYDALDYFRIDPHLGGDEALCKLTEEMHRRGMKLLLDISINHTSSASKWFNKCSEFYPAEEGAFQNRNSPYRDFYFFEDDNSYKTWFGVETMPQLNYASRNLREEIYGKKDSVLKKWMQPPFGIDGWRFDVADCLARNDRIDVHAEVIREIRSELKSVNPASYLLAEEWQDCSVDLQGDMWDATMNYFGCARPVREFAGAKDLYLERNPVLKGMETRLTAPQLKNRIIEFYKRLPGGMQLLQFNLIDSHDIVRLHNMKKVSGKNLESAVIMQFTLPGSPSIYYGDEILLGGEEDDVDLCRYPFDWNWQGNEDSVRMHGFYKKLCQLRKESPALREGGFKFFYAEDYAIGWSRFTADEAFFVLCSVDDRSHAIDIQLNHYGVDADSELTEVFGKTVEMRKAGGKITVDLPPHQNYVLLCKQGKSAIL